MCCQGLLHKLVKAGEGEKIQPEGYPFWPFPDGMNWNLNVGLSQFM